VKFLAFILSIYILGLSFVTCNDNDIPDNTSNNDIVHVLKSDQHSDSGETDFCSPFCSCQCCQININTVALISYDVISLDIFTTIFSHPNQLAQDVTYSFFQPPQV